MDLVTPIWTIVSSSWGCISHHSQYISDLEEKLSSLKDALDELKGMHEDLRQRVSLVGENPRKVVSKQVEDWLRKVEDLEKKVDRFLQESNVNAQSRCLARCCHCRSSYKLGKQAVKFLGVVNDLKDKGRFDVVGFECTLTSSSRTVKKIEGLSEIPMDEKVVGMETSFDVAWRHLHNESSGIIGLYGMGGVGKTTLLKKINNELFKRNNGHFDLVIWIVASKQAKEETIQDTILRKLDIPIQSSRDKDEHEKAKIIYILLRERKFVLLLDDLWEFVDLVKVGIPLPSCQNMQKLIFTTRSEEVCAQMGAHISIKVRCLTPEAAWSLFQERVGETTLNSHPQIPKLARLVAIECDGLPLALITIGRAMASRKKPYEWEYAIQVLKTYPSRFVGMADLVLPVLKFSYDSLPDEIVKTCFLYCSLFPEDHEIVQRDLVDLWTGEGFLNDFTGINEARNYGLYIIETLKLACLLEEGQSEFLVKMHDVIRDMALWIACDCGLKKNRFLTQEHFNSMKKHESVAEWPEVERASLWGNDEEVLQSAHYPSLITYLIRRTSFRDFPSEFFEFLPTIRVLDLSENERLLELPNAIDSLTTLEYLNLSKTKLRTLPDGLKNLRGLRYLLLDFMTCLKDIPTEIISNMPHLRVFRMNFSFGRGIKGLLGALEANKHICEISIYLHSPVSSTMFRTSKKLQECIRNLRIEECSKTLTFELFHSKYLESLHMYNMLNLTAIKSAHLRNLQSVIVYRCSLLINLNFLVFAPNIQSLWVTYCESLQGLITETASNESLNTFSSLKRIRLDNLPCLKGIYPGVIASPSLEEVYISKCPQLSKLPFIPDAKRLMIMKAEIRWFRGLQWEDESAKSRFCHQFKSLGIIEGTGFTGIEPHWPEDMDLYHTRVTDSNPFSCSTPREKERQRILWSSIDM